MTRSQEVQETHPLEKPRGIDVNHAAPLRHRHGAAVALVFADDLAVHKDRDQGTLWEPPHVGLRRGGNKPRASTDGNTQDVINHSF